MIKNLYLNFINFFKDLAKVIVKTCSCKENSFILPLIMVVVNILPFLFLPIFNTKAIISSDFGALYLLLLLPLNGVIIFFHSLLSQSNILCISGLRAGMQSLVYALVLLFSVISTAMNHSSLNLEIIGLSGNSLFSLAFELPIAFLYFFMLLIYDNSFIADYSKEYSGFYSWLLKFSGNMFPLKEIIFFVVIFMGGSVNPLNPDNPGIIPLIFKVVACLAVYKVIETSIPKLRVDQLIEIFFNRLLFICIIWLVIKAYIIFS